MILFVSKGKIIVLHLRHALSVVHFFDVHDKTRNVELSSVTQMYNRWSVSANQYFSYIIQCERDTWKNRENNLLALYLSPFLPVYTRYTCLISPLIGLRGCLGFLEVQNCGVFDAFKQAIYIRFLSHYQPKYKTITLWLLSLFEIFLSSEIFHIVCLFSTIVFTGT